LVVRSIGFRVIYSLGFPGNIGQITPLFPAVLDITDYDDPSDFVYNKYLNQYLTVLNRSNFISVNMFGSNSSSYVDTVVGVNMIFIMYYQNLLFRNKSLSYYLTKLNEFKLNFE
jgi:hypothetical protein